MKRRELQHHMDGLLALLLFGVFAVCVLTVLLTGAQAYRRLTVRDQNAYDRRTPVQYIATRVRQGDTLDGVAVESFEGSTALALRQDGYVTRIYWYDGYLMELYTGEDAALSPEDGEKVVAAGGLALSLEDDLLTVEVTGVSGETDTLRLSLRSGEGAL